MGSIGSQLRPSSFTDKRKNIERRYKVRRTEETNPWFRIMLRKILGGAIRTLGERRIWPDKRKHIAQSATARPTKRTFGHNDH